MVQCCNPALDRSFAALSDATRRGVIDQLGRADASITSLAGQFHMTLTGMKKHVSVLEQAGLITTEKVGRVRTCKLRPAGLAAEAEWIDAHRKLFEARFDALEEIISEMKQEKVDGPARGNANGNGDLGTGLPFHQRWSSMVDRSVANVRFPPVADISALLERLSLNGGDGSGSRIL